MEWSMPVNDIFDEQVTRITGGAMLPKNFSADVRTTRAVLNQISNLIDQLGKESATSQGLNKVITSAEKLRANPNHVIYLLKDHAANNGGGDIIGLLKVGRKHLFLFDSHEVVHEVEPLCVLDFYVLHNRQRKGFGRLLFDYMLNELEVEPSQLAIDGPSEKMEQFLSRNYGIKNLMRQNNNFAVAPAFFDRSDDEISDRAGEAAAAPVAAVGRFAAARPTSAIANVIHGAGHDDASRRSPSPAAEPGAAELGGVPAEAVADEPAEAAADEIAEPDADEPVPDEFGNYPVLVPPGTKPTCVNKLDGRAYYGFTPMELLTTDDEESLPDIDDDEYERYAFDMDQPAYERRDERRARGPERYSPPQAQ